jgi:hypothetical protein
MGMGVYSSTPARHLYWRPYYPYLGLMLGQSQRELPARVVFEAESCADVNS